MKSVLISIQPEWCEKIVNGEKTVEIRKTRPKLETPFKCYIYESSGNSRVGNQNFNVLIKGSGRKKIIGEFICDKIVFLGNISTDPWGNLMGDVHERHKKIVMEQACLSEEELLAYGGKYAWQIADLVIYDEPKELGEFYRWTDYDDSKKTKDLVLIVNTMYLTILKTVNIVLLIMTESIVCICN